MNPWALAVLPLAGVVVGALLQSWLGEYAERHKQLELLKSEAYADYLKAVAARTLLRSDEERVTSFRALAEAKARIAVYGSDKVLRALARFDQAGAVLTDEHSAAEFVKLVSAMRPTKASSLDQEIRIALLGWSKTVHPDSSSEPINHDR
jgi:hypothetical protein